MSVKRATQIALCAIFAISACLTAHALAGPDDNKMQMPKPPLSSAQPAFDHLKKLAGDWILAEGDQKGQLAVQYKVSSNGTAIIETLFPGSDHEMVSIYHLDGDKLMMTHFCAVGNQPQMHAAPAQDKLVFTFTGGSNMKDSDGHMHAMTMTFVDDDHLKEDWTWKGNDGSSGIKAFSFERKKA